MKKAIIIIGGLTVIGVGAYLFFKPKKGVKVSGNQSGTDTTSAVPPKGTQLTTPQEVEELALKIVEARELTKIICDLKKAYNITNDNLNDYMNFSSDNTNDYMNFSIGSFNLNPFDSSSPVNIGINQLSPLLTSANSLLVASKNASTKKANRKKALETIADSINKLAKLGYREDNCKTTRLKPLPL